MFLSNKLTKKKLLPSRTLEEDYCSADDDPLHFFPHNRGNKLKRFAAGLKQASRASSQRLWVSQLPEGHLELIEIGKKNAIVRRGGAKRQSIERFDPEEDPYAGISVKDILTPPERAEDVLTCPQYRRAFNSNKIEALSNVAMSMIESEAFLNRQLKRATSMVLERNVALPNDVADDFGARRSSETLPKSDADTSLEEQQAWNEARDALQAAVSASNEFILRLTAARSRLTRVQSQRRYLHKTLKEIASKRTQSTTVLASSLPVPASAAKLASMSKGKKISLQSKSNFDAESSSSKPAARPRARTSRNSGGDGRSNYMS